MRRRGFLFGLLSAAASLAVADPTWPAPSDELEEIVYQLHGFRGRLFADTISPCSNEASGPGRQAAAAWIRAAFHDMSTANTYFGIGGLDASLQFELRNGENPGTRQNNTLRFLSNYLSTRASMADLLAAGVYASVRSCGGLAVPLRTGRIDATAAGPLGVPQPQNSQYTFIRQYSRMNFNVSEMIELTACGHSIGGVHTTEFPDLVPAGSSPNNESAFDSTVAVFDNKVVTEFLAGNTTDPLVVQPSIRVGRNSDTKVFTADGNVTLQTLTDPTQFQMACQRVLQKMIEVVPPNVVLSSTPLAPYMVKPVAMQLMLDNDPSMLALSGWIRVKTTSLPLDQISSLTLQWTDRNGGNNCGRVGSCSTTATVQGMGHGLDDSFGFFPISTKIDASTGISSFTVKLNLGNGTSQLYDNNGATYPMTDAVLLQRLQSCLLQTSGNMTATALVRNDRLNMPVTLNVSYLVPRGTPDGNPVPAINTATMNMTRGACVGRYTFYSTSYTIPGGLSFNARLSVTSGSGSGALSDAFRAASELAGTCSRYTASAQCSVGGGTASSSSSSSLSSSRSTSSSTSLRSSSTVPSASGTRASTTSALVTSTSPTPSTSAAPSTSTVPARPKIANYDYVSCWTEGSKVRALSDASYSDSNMTLDSCANYCANLRYAYFGTEYARECYCDEELADGTGPAPESECNMACAGNQSQTCGGPNRLSLYELHGVPPPRPSQPGAVGGWSWHGCMTEARSMRALSGSSWASDNMTLGSCASFCAGFKFFGAEYRHQCFCGDSFNAGSVSAPLSECSMLCSGNYSQFCGGPDRLSVYTL